MPLLHRVKGLITPISRRALASTTRADIATPKKRYRDPVSVLRALDSCVEPHLGLPDYRCAYEPWLGSSLQLRSNLQAKAAGRNAARHVARQFLANDLTALATEVSAILFLRLMLLYAFMNCFHV